MHVICKNCSNRIAVSSRPTGSTNVSNIRTEGKVSITGGKISFGQGGKISFGRGGRIGCGPPRASTFACPKCGKSYDYEAHEILDD